MLAYTGNINSNLKHASASIIDATQSALNFYIINILKLNQAKYCSVTFMSKNTCIGFRQALFAK